MIDKAKEVAEKMEYLLSLREKLDISAIPTEDQAVIVLAEMEYLSTIEPILEKYAGFSVVK